MCRCPQRDQPRLKPHEVFDLVEKLIEKHGGTLNEVIMRRVISALYLSLFNYWTEKAYTKGRRGRGPCQDWFNYSDFHKDLSSVGLDSAIFTLYLHRVAADHYALNPTFVRPLGRPWATEGAYPVEINLNSLIAVFKLSKEVLNVLEKL
jgi:hypothetical protein